VRGVDKPVVPHQVKAELRARLDAAGKTAVAADIWTSASTDGTTVVMADVDQADLDAVLAAHTADPLYGASAELRELVALAAKPTWTQQEQEAALRAVIGKLLA